MADLIVDLATIKMHLRVSSGTTEDALIGQYAAAAQTNIEDYLDGVIPGSSDDVGDPDADPVVEPLADEVPSPIIQALLLMVADMYENRSAVITGTTVAENPTLVRLLHCYRRGIGI